MEWTMITDGRLKAYAYDEKGHDWSISFDGYADCETPLGGDGVVLTRNGERVAAVSVEYYGADAEAAGYDMDALIAEVVEAVKSIAEALAYGTVEDAPDAERCDEMAADAASRFEISNRDSMAWVKGSIGCWSFAAKVFDLPSAFGIPTPRFPDGGNVSKLSIYDDLGRLVYHYDRGLDFTKVASDTLAYVVSALEAKFCKAGE